MVVRMMIKATLALCASMNFYTLVDTGNPLALLGLVCCAISLAAMWLGD